MPLPAVYRESLPVLLLAGLGLVAAGLVLGGMRDVLERTPGLLVMVPALIALRGGISGALGARMGSAFHMGLISEGSLWNDEAQQNVLAAVLLSALFSFLAGVLSYATSILLGLQTASLVSLALIATLAGTLAGISQVGITFGIILAAFRWGLDPDNVTTPTLATVGDVITILLLFVIALSMGGVA